ncbi:MAG: CrcB family protein [Nitrososphaerota archaeon]|jgi:CrcB protein|nr:CrcB family protein [Nitrososphaerota archaeon]
MLEFALLAVGAVAGAYLRYRMVESPITVFGLPINILLVNVVGSFVLGVFSVLLVALNLGSHYSLLIAAGFCGSFTTMSSFALETVNMFENNHLRLFTLNILVNVGLSIGAVIGGRVAGNVWIEKVMH